MKDTLSITIPAVGKPSEAGSSNTSETTVCHNLRQSFSPTGVPVLKPVGDPLSVADGAWKPLAVMNAGSETEMLIAADGLTLASIAPTGGNAPETIAALPGKALCATVDGSTLTVMTTEGPFTAEYNATDAEWTIKGLRSRFAAVSLMAEETTDCTSTIGSRRLSTSYPAGVHSLRDSDLRTISGDLRRAYRDICSQATAQGAFCAPMLCRYHLIDRSGTRVYTSQPLLLGASESSRMTSPVTVGSSDRQTLDSFSISSRAWRMRLKCTAAESAMLKDIARIEITASPQFHPYDQSDDASCTLVSSTSGDDFLRITVPGAGRAVASTNSRQGRAIVRKAVAAIDSMERTIAYVTGPFADGDAIEIAVEPDHALSDPLEESDAMIRGMTACVKRADELLCRLSPPHRFSASAVADASGVTVWGSLAAIRHDGYPLETFAASRAADGSWHAAVAVTFAGGEETVVCVSEGTSGAPLTLNPVLSYPAPDAVEMTIALEAGGKTFRETFALQPDASGRHAIHVHPDLQPFSLSTEVTAFVIPAEKRADRRFRSIVAATRSQSPCVPLATAMSGDGDILAIAAASRSQSSWDFGRTRFTAFSTAGIHSLMLNQAMDSMSASLVDRRTLSAPSALAIADNRLIACAGGQLVEVGASRAVTLIDHFSADTLAVSHSFRELLASDGGSTTVVSLDDMRLTTRDIAIAGPAVTHRQGGGGTFISTGRRLVDIEAEQPADHIHVDWRSEIVPAGGMAVEVGRLSLVAQSESLIDGTIQASRMSLDDSEPSPSLDLHFAGRLRSPMRTRVLSRPMRRLSIGFSADVSPDTTIEKITLECKTATADGTR